MNARSKVNLVVALLVFANVAIFAGKTLWRSM